MSIPLFPEWMSAIPLQQQAVIVLALRGPDGFPKRHLSKRLLYHYRATVMGAAHLGRCLQPGEACSSMMGLTCFEDADAWAKVLREFQDVEDELPLHYYTHLMHGAQVVAYKHPESLFQRRWLSFYLQCCDYLHVPPENIWNMDRRLNDFGRPLDAVIPGVEELIPGEEHPGLADWVERG